MNLYESYIAPSISRWNAERDRKNARTAFNQHYFNVFSWIDCNADMFKYRPKKRSLDQKDESMDESCPMDLSERLD